MDLTAWLSRRFSLAPVDLLIVVLYLAAIITIGFIVKRRAQRSIGSYFLGERQLPWWALAMSGSSSYFDITGTMWIVSLFVVLGLKGMWYQWMWGFPITVFYMAYMGPWIRRSGVMTGSEWMETRFGAGKAGEYARLSYTLFAVLTITAFLAYGAVGMGKFGSVYIKGLSDQACAAWIIGLTGVYVIVGGFRGVVLVEILQTVVLSCGALLIAYLGFSRISWPAIQSATYPGWGSIAPVGRIESLADRPEYYLFGLLTLAYVVKGILLDLSGPEQLYDFQRFLAARNPRDASKLGALWGVVHTVRWPMAMAIAGLGLMGVYDAQRMDAEKVLPVVLEEVVPVGLRGFAIAALLSGFLATFSSTVNGGASYLVKDIYHKYLRPQASQKSLIYAGYVSSALLIVAGIMVGWGGKSIHAMFSWIMNSLGAGVLLPNVLRWYWWRLNGWGYAAGATSGMVLSLVQGRFLPNLPVFETLPAIALLVLLVTLVVTYATRPADRETLVAFYRQVQPAGWWGPVLAEVREQDPTFERRRPFRKDLLNVALGLPCVLAMYTFPLYLVLHRWPEALGLLAVTLALCGALYFTWYRKLPEIAEGDEAEPEQAPPEPS